MRKFELDVINAANAKEDKEFALDLFEEDISTFVDDPVNMSDVETEAWFGEGKIGVAGLGLHYVMDELLTFIEEFQNSGDFQKEALAKKLIELLSGNFENDEKSDLFGKNNLHGVSKVSGKNKEKSGQNEKKVIQNLKNILNKIVAKENEIHAMELNTKHQNFLGEGSADLLMKGSHEYFLVNENVNELKNIIKKIIENDIKNTGELNNKRERRIENKFYNENRRYPGEQVNVQTSKERLNNLIPKNYWKGFNAKELLEMIEEVYPSNEEEKILEEQAQKVTRYVNEKVDRRIILNTNPAKKSEKPDYKSLANVQKLSQTRNAKHAQRENEKAQTAIQKAINNITNNLNQKRVNFI